MILHGDSLDDGSTHASDVVVVGAGPVGLTAALDLARRGYRVDVLESGEEKPNARIQDLNDGESAGLHLGKLRDIRLRQLGGTMIAWGGNSRPLDPIDFQPRPWVGLSGWPIKCADLDAHYPRAHETLDLGRYDYGADGYDPPFQFGEDALDWEPITFRLSGFVNGSTARHRGDFGQTFQEDLRKHDNLRLHLGVTALRLLANDNASGTRCSGISAMTMAGKELHFRGSKTVLALGGIETARFLLAQKALHLPAALKAHGFIGRCFMEHPHGLGGILVANARIDELNRFARGNIDQNGAVYQFRYRVSDAAQMRYEILNMCIQIISADVTRADSSPYEADFRQLETELGGERLRRFYAVFLAEQEPSPASSVELGEARDFFEVPLPRVNWKISDLDFRTIHSTFQRFARVVNRNPHLKYKSYIPESAAGWGLGWGAHHMGTTRMSLDPNDGVVDRNCEVHNVRDLFIAGSSVYPTGGMANPLLTSIALGYRLTETLVAQLAE